MEVGLLDEPNLARPSPLSSGLDADNVILAKDQMLPQADYSASRPIQEASSLVFSVQELSLVKAEFTCCGQLDLLRISDFEPQACSGESEAHHLRDGAAREEQPFSRAERSRVHLTTCLPALSQVHNRFVNSSEQMTSLSPPWTQWTDSELSSRLEAKYDPLSALPLPSLSSSSISSLRSQAEEIYPTPEVFPENTRLPFMPRKATPYGFCSSPASESGRLAFMNEEGHPSGATRERLFNQQLPAWYCVPGSRRGGVDWARWKPTKFQCSFCKERFLIESDLRNHLGTHKRYREYVKRELQYIYPDLGGSNLKNSTQELLQKSLAYRKPVKETANNRPLQYDKTVSLGNTNDRGNAGQPTFSAHLITSQKFGARDGYTPSHTLHRASHLGDEQFISLGDSSNKYAIDLEVTGATIFEIASEIVPSLQNAHPSMHLELTTALAGSSINNQKSGGCSEEIKKLDDSPDAAIFDFEMDTVQDNGHHQFLAIAELSLASTKHKLTARIMNEFLAFSKRNLASVVQTHGTDSERTTNDAPEPRSGSSYQNSSSDRSRQYTIGHENSNGNEDGGDDDNDDQRPPKRPRTSSTPLDIFNSGTKFACPYRKYDPRKYCVRNWRSCALTPLDSVARVKAHLYRHHRIFQCQRCKGLFLNQNILDEHILALEGCKPARVNLAEGITADIEKRLRSRKKTHPNQTEADRWIEIYRILFPTATSPSPFFEPVEENVDQPSDSANFAGLEAYTQQELPKIFWAALEEVVTKEMQPVEERIRIQLIGVIRDCQDQVFSTYQSMVTSTLDSLLGDSLTRDKLLKQFEPLSQNTSTQSYVRSTDSFNLPLPRLNDVAESAPIENDSQIRDSNISAFNSSTTLSSIFDSSTTLNSAFNSSATLSSIASFPMSLEAQKVNAGSPSKIAGLTHCGDGANDNTAATTSMQTIDSWATDLGSADLTQFDADWDVEAATYEI